MRRLLVLMAILVLLAPIGADAQDSRAALEAIAKAMGSGTVKSIQYSGNGVNFQVGQSYMPGIAWPRFVVKSYTRSVSYETNAIQDQLVRTVGETPQRGGGGGGLAPGAEQRQNFAARGDYAWNVAGDATPSTPVNLADRQLQLWTTPHGVVKMAIASNATVQGNTFSFAVPGRFRVRATVNSQNLVEKIDAVVANAVVGDMPVEIQYSEYKDVGGGVKFPMKVRQAMLGHPVLDLTVTDVQPNAAVNIAIPAPVLAGCCSVRPRGDPDGGRRRLVLDRRHPSQRPDRDEGPPDPRRKPAQRRSRRGRAGGGQEALRASRSSTSSPATITSITPAVSGRSRPTA